MTFDIEKEGALSKARLRLKIEESGGPNNPLDPKSVRAHNDLIEELKDDLLIAKIQVLPRNENLP